MSARRIRAYFLMLVATVVWALAGPVIKFTLGGISPIPFLTYRFGLSAVVSLVLILLYRDFPRSPKLLAQSIIYGFLTSTVSLGLLFFGLEKTTVLDMTVISIIAPLLIAVAGVKYLHEHITKRERVGIIIAFAGTMVVLLEPFFRGADGIEFSGNILLFFYLLTTVVSTIWAKKLLQKGVGAGFLANIAFVVGFATVLPVAIYTNSLNNMFNIALPYHLGVIYMALLSGNLAYTLSNKAQKTIEVGEAAVFTYLYPIIAAPAAVLWLGEKISPVFVVGSVVVGIGVVIAEVKKKG